MSRRLPLSWGDRHATSQPNRAKQRWLNDQALTAVMVLPDIDSLFALVLRRFTRGKLECA